MILTDENIRELSLNPEKGNVALIEPFEEERLQSASYDVSIGEYVYILNKQSSPLNLIEQDVLSSMYSKVNLDEPYIISPGEYILVDLNETINLTDNLCAHIRARTKFTRMGLLVADHYCNPSYSGQPKIGLLNAGTNAIILTKGLIIAQFVFEELTQIPSLNKLYRNKKNASYQNEKDFIGPKFDKGELDVKVMELYKKLLENLYDEKGK